jgi:alpha-amylase/alpha-mannosidase (GH57 family)
MTERCLCIHGHFYQPPRENPWLEAIEIQDEAYPYHDWNELITAECYAPNALSRILDGKGRIRDIVSNYAKISFDMGPTLLSWLEKNALDAYEAVLEADSQSQEWRSGHGAAMAQCYNHMIMPLASGRDKLTQVLWGVKDFRKRFGRDPEGMWLPETAVDLESLDIMAGEGIAFTVLAQHQARGVRPNGEAEFADVSGGDIDPSKPYLLRLHSGREISLFFYDGSVSQAVAFEGLLKSGGDLAARLMGGFSKKREHPQLMHIATDGESYGHHHKFGDMALAYALHSIEQKDNARLTNYGEYLALHPPEDEVEIIEHTSWSCGHGIERWKSDCGCSTGSNPGWSQAWREPLRSALDWLREETDSLYEEKASELFKDPWKTRDAYIDVIIDRSEKNIEGFLSEHYSGEFDASCKTEAMVLLELQRHAMLMYTSCGWFFDDISGIEAVQVLRYAGRVIQLAQFLFGKDMEKEFLERLGHARSNIPSKGNGAAIYMRSVKPHIVTLEKVAAHYAISSLFEEYPEETGIFCYRIHSLDYQKLQAAKSSLVVGLCEVTSEITLRSVEMSFAVLHLGDHDFNCGVGSLKGFDAYKDMATELTEAFEHGAFADVVRLIDTNFGTTRFTLFDLFRDEQRHILDTLIKETMDSFEDSYRRIYDENRILMGFLKDTDVPVPRAFLTAAEFTLNLDLKRMLMGKAEAGEISGIMEEIESWDITPNKVDLEFNFRRTLEREAAFLEEEPTDLQKLMNMDRLMEIALSLPFTLNLWMMQNTFFRMATTAYAELGMEDMEYHTLWDKAFRSLGEKLNFNLEAVIALADKPDG